MAGQPAAQADLEPKGRSISSCTTAMRSRSTPSAPRAGLAGAAGLVHVGLRQQDAHAGAAGAGAAVGVEARVLLLRLAAGPSARRPARRPRSRCCGACGRSGRPGCPGRPPASRPGRRPSGRGGRGSLGVLVLPGARSLALALALGALLGLLALLGARSARRPRRSARSPPRSPAPRPRSGTTSVAMTVSSGSSRKVTPLGAGTSDSGSVAAISMLETSTTIWSGMSVGSASMLSSRVTCSSTPPSFTPGDSSPPSSCTRDRGLDLLVEADLEQVDVHELVADRMELLVLDDHRAGLPPTSMSISAEPSASSWRRARASTLKAEFSPSAAAVDDAGHEALAAQAAWRASRARGAPRRSRVGRCACHDGWPV